MNLFKFRSKSLNISDCDPTFKVKYLGNVLTSFLRGEGCVDRPVSILWNNYLANSGAPVDMQLTVCNAGLKAVTNEQGLTEYRAYRIPYCIHNPQFPKLFIWVYRHEGKKMKVEVRCHAVLCKTEAKAKAIYEHLRDRLAFALGEFAREKTRRQNSRLLLQRTLSVPTGLTKGTPLTLPLRTKFLNVGQHFKPPASLGSLSTSASRLGPINEDLDEPEPIITNPNRLSWQPQSTHLESWAEEEVEDDVFLAPMIFNSSCRLSDAISQELFAQSAGSRNSTEIMELFGNMTSISPASNNDVKYPNGTISVAEPGGTISPNQTEESQEKLENIQDFDTRSTESGFSEQDTHDL